MVDDSTMSGYQRYGASQLPVVNISPQRGSEPSKALGRDSFAFRDCRGEDLREGRLDSAQGRDQAERENSAAQPEISHAS